MDGKSKLTGWESYPENLRYVQSCDLHGYNFTSYSQRLQAESKRLFVRGSERIAVKVLEFGGQGKFRTNSYLHFNPTSMALM
jgi:hypothetical protein